MCKACEDRLDKRAAKMQSTGHTGHNIGRAMSDQIECSCGWKSYSYWDGAEWAWEDFDKHLASL